MLVSEPSYDFFFFEDIQFYVVSVLIFRFLFHCCINVVCTVSDDGSYLFREDV